VIQLQVIAPVLMPALFILFRAERFFLPVTDNSYAVRGYAIGNTPVWSSNWLASGPIGLRRSLLAVIAGLILPASMCRTLTPEAGRGLPFWTKLRACHSPADRSEFSQRTARWGRLAAAALDFYR
jgi:hypothetical protein